VKTRLDADCGSDLLTATVRIKLKNTKKVKKGWKLDIEYIHQKNTKMKLNRNWPQ
jgi:hypothetical protein